MIEMACGRAMGEIGGCWSAKVCIRNCSYGEWESEELNEVPGLVLSKSRFVIIIIQIPQKEIRKKNISETYHSKILLTNLPVVSHPSGNVLWNAHEAGRLSCTSVMMYAPTSSGSMSGGFAVPDDEV